MTRRVAALAALAVAAGALAACTPEPPQPDPAPTAPTPAAVLDADRLERILGEVQATVEKADEALDPALLEERVAGPARELRTAQYALAAASEGQYAPTALTMDTQVDVVAATEDFPRAAVSVSQIPEGGNLPILTVLRQEHARSQYMLWGWVELLPGVEMPPTATPETGSPAVPADAEGLVLSPEQTVAAFAERLNDPQAESADLFGEDRFTEDYRAFVTDLDTSIEAAGEASASAEAGPHGTGALGTVNGGAIVVGTVTWDLTIRKTVEGSTLRMGARFGALLGDDTEVRGTVTGRYLATVAFYVPPAGAGEIEVLGASEALTEVTRDDEAAP